MARHHPPVVSPSLVVAAWTGCASDGALLAAETRNRGDN